MLTLQVVSIAILVAFLAIICQIVVRLSPGESPQLPAFEVIAPGVWRLNYLWKPVPLAEAPVATFLLSVVDDKGDTNLILVDGGVPGKLAVDNLVSQLRTAEDKSPLRLLIGKLAVGT